MTGQPPGGQSGYALATKLREAIRDIHSDCPPNMPDGMKRGIGKIGGVIAALELSADDPFVTDQSARDALANGEGLS